MKPIKLDKNLKFFHWEVFRVTAFVFVVLLLLKLAVFNLHIFDSFSQSLKDFDFTDLIYLKEKSPDRQPNPNKDIVLVNIGTDRQQIARQINILERFHPKVLAVDAWFLKQQLASRDSLLEKTISENRNIILAGFLEKVNEEGLRYVRSYPAIATKSADGYANFVSENENTIRYFSPREVSAHDTVNAFAAEIVKQYATKKYASLTQRKNVIEYIRYKYLPADFLKFDRDEIREDNPDLVQLKDKIVVIGQLGNDLQTNLLEDLNFTPLNKKFSGRSMPDTYGTYIHANIISMILHEDYTDKLNVYFTWFISFLICYIHLYFFIGFYIRRPMWFHVSTKIIQLISGAVIVGTALLLLDVFRLKIESGYILLPVLLSVDCIYFYDGLIKIIHKRWPLKSEFINAHH